MRDGVVLLLMGVLAGPAAAAAHPGQHLDLRITISDEEITYNIILSTDLSNVVYLNDFADFNVLREQERYEFVDPERARRTREAFAEYFKAKNAVTIDGVRVTPLLGELEFVPNPALAGDEDPYSFPPDARVVLVYPCKGRPRQVSLVWEVYPQDASLAAFGENPTLDVMAELDAYDENWIIVFSASEPEVVWHAPGKPVRQRVEPLVAESEPKRVAVPLLSVGVVVLWIVGALVLGFSRRWQAVRRPALALAVVAIAVVLLGRGVLVVHVVAPWSPAVRLPGEPEAIELFTSLHRNVYRAFDYKEEGDIYDVLAQSVDGELLDQVYNEVYQSLILRDQGGAVARVQSVDILDAEVESVGVVSDSDAAAFRIRSRWQVHGAVYHWGHLHSRTNEYRARHTVAQREGHWKITGVEVLAQQRVVKEGDDPDMPARGKSGDEF